MKASLCVGEYCENAYNVEGLDIRSIVWKSCAIA